MAEKIEDKVKKKMKDGWIKTWMAIEVMATSEAAAKSALEKHIKALEEEDLNLVYKKEWKEVKEIKNPMPNIEKAYSYIIELEMVSHNFDKLVYIMMNYAPSAVEVLEPDHIKLDAGEAQGVLTVISDMMHKFAKMGVGGIVVRT